MINKDKKISETLIQKGKIVDLYHSDFENQDGIVLRAEVIKHPGGVCIAATHDNHSFYLVNQFRYAMENTMLEFPAGKLNLNEDPLLASARELEEEIGYRANTIVPMGFVALSPAYLNEIIHLYFATDLEFVGQNLDPFEELDVMTLSLDEIEHLIYDNSITDGKTIALTYRLRNYLKR